jgi:MFS family permease
VTEPAAVGDNTAAPGSQGRNEDRGAGADGSRNGRTAGALSADYIPPPRRDGTAGPTTRPPARADKPAPGDSTPAVDGATPAPGGSTPAVDSSAADSSAADSGSTPPVDGAAAGTPATGGNPARGSMFSSLRVRNYRLYASGQVVSLTGTWMQRVAQDWLVLELSNSGTALGITLALQFGPTLLFSLWGGVLADRYDKRRLLIVTQSAMVLVALALGLLDVTGVVVLWHVYLLAGLLGVVSALDVPVRQSFVVEMVGRDDLANAVGLNSATFNTARIVGPAVAGVMINAVGTGWVFLGNAASTVAVIVVLKLMRAGELSPAPRVARGRGQLREGLRYVRSRADLVTPMLLVLVIGTFGLNFQITLALVARDVFGRGAGSYGLLSTMLAVGSLAGALVATRRRRRPRLRFLFVAIVLFGLLEAAVGLMPTYPAVALTLVPTGAAALVFTTAANSSVQLGADPTMRGRVMALYLLCFMGGAPVGAPAMGVVADVFGARAGLVGGGLGCVLAAGLIGLVYARRQGISVAPRVASAVRHPRLPRRRPAGTVLSRRAARRTVGVWARPGRRSPSPSPSSRSPRRSASRRSG